MEGAAGPLVRAVSGLDSGEFEHPVIVRPTSMRGSKSAAAAVAQTAAVSNSDFFSSQCFTGTESESFSTNSDGELPKVTFSGNKLNQESLSGPGCGYTPVQSDGLVCRRLQRQGSNHRHRRLVRFVYDPGGCQRIFKEVRPAAAHFVELQHHLHGAERMHCVLLFVIFSFGIFSLIQVLSY